MQVWVWWVWSWVWLCMRGVYEGERISSSLSSCLVFEKLRDITNPTHSFSSLLSLVFFLRVERLVKALRMQYIMPPSKFTELAQVCMTTYIYPPRTYDSLGISLCLYVYLCLSLYVRVIYASVCFTS